MQLRGIAVVLTAALLASLAGAMAGYAAMRATAMLLPGDVTLGARQAILTLIGYGVWAAVALVVSAAWLRWRARPR